MHGNIINVTITIITNNISTKNNNNNENNNNNNNNNNEICKKNVVTIRHLSRSNVNINDKLQQYQQKYQHQ